MYAKQLSVFIENREGRLEQVLEVLKQCNVNILSLSLADTSDYGLLRLIVDNPETGYSHLTENGFSAILTDLISVKISHKPGSLQQLLKFLSNSNINVEYMYGLTVSGSEASVAMKVSDFEATRKIMDEIGVEELLSDDISKLNS